MSGQVRKYFVRLFRFLRLLSMCEEKRVYEVETNVIHLSPLAVAWWIFLRQDRTKKEPDLGNTCTITLVIMHERRGNRTLRYAKQRPLLRESKSLNPWREFYFRLYISASVSKFRIEYFHQTFTTRRKSRRKPRERITYMYKLKKEKRSNV